MHYENILSDTFQKANITGDIMVGYQSMHPSENHRAGEAGRGPHHCSFM